MTIGVLLLGFGGVTETCCQRKPECPGRVECFVSKVLGDDPRMAGRVAEVAEHYHHLGGTSPYNDLTFAQAEALENALAEDGHPMPVRCGFRNWTPWLRDALSELRQLGCDAVIPVPLSAQVSSRGWHDYLTEAEEAVTELGNAAPRLLPAVAPYTLGEAYAEACAARIHEAVAAAGWDDARFAAAGLICSAHAIPVPAERASPYRAHTEQIAAAVATACNHAEHHVAFQSAPDVSRIPWSEPRVEGVVDHLAAAGVTDVVIQAVGFLVDHVEVIFDLDHDLREHAEAHGMTLIRAACVHDHPAFIGAMREAILTVTAEAAG